MKIKQDIQHLVDGGEYDKAISILDREIERHPDDAELWYMRGRVYWRLGRRGNAISDYEEAVHLDPKSDAAAALEMARGIMDFFNPDLFNP